jgi:hypothetical protein
MVVKVLQASRQAFVNTHKEDQAGHQNAWTETQDPTSDKSVAVTLSTIITPTDPAAYCFLLELPLLTINWPIQFDAGPLVK